MKTPILTRTLTIKISIILLLVSCKEKQPDLNTVNPQKFIGTRKLDTTILSLRVAGTDFYGTMEVLYNVGMKDSGNVKGTLHGDTLFMGDYYHMHDGQDEWKREPLRLLKRKNKLIRGEGIVATFANIPFFLNYPPVQFNEKEQFVLYPAK